MDREEDKPGIPLYCQGRPYGYEVHARRYPGGENLLRTERVCQPSALRAGDILATGDRVLSEPRNGGRGKIFIHLDRGLGGYWLDVPEQLPLALLVAEDNAPSEVWQMATG